jgi:hypothetical protein
MIFTVIKKQVNSSELRERIGLTPDCVQARIMKGMEVMWVAETVIGNEKKLNRLVKQELKKLEGAL